ncbi:4Fe-4S binding protein [Salinibacter ruber]|uniref:4Fe-4S binding protein n=1 Tax=Salinibacter ruber TaxID=146919 RepID=UPI0021697313
MEFSDEEERPQGTTVENVCPADAISFNSAHTVMEVSDSCFGCGLCAMRCPFDSIYISAESDRPELGSKNFDQYTQVPDQNYQSFFSQLSQEVVRSDDGEEILDQLVHNSRDRTQSDFYPLVASLFTSLGLPTTLPPGGDTNNRIDALAYHPEQSMPIEIKSPTETRDINVKSIQQAIENKIVLDQRHQGRFPSKSRSSSIVLGYKYPNDRSDVESIIEDCFEVYDIRVGIIDLKNLYRAVWNKNVLREDIDITRLLHLKGSLQYEALQ